MKQKLFAVLSILVLVGMLPGTAFAAPKPVTYDLIDVGPQLRTWEATPERIASEADEGQAVAAAALTPADYPCYVETKKWMALDDFNSEYFFTDYYLIAQTASSELWVQADLSYPAGDPRPTPVVTCEQAALLLSEFDSNMYPVEAEFFGTPDAHTGENSLLVDWGYFDPGYFYNEAGRQVVLVSNVRDDAYFDSTYPNYIAGFYSPSFERYFDRNIMSIDSHDWANRVGPGGTRPYLYEGVFAHEYQHLLHDDYDSDEENFVNEGMADLASVLTGYGESVTGHLQDTAAHPENSLVLWGDQGGLEILTDYGQSFLFQYYLMEQYGQTFTQALFHNQDNGITGINSTLAAFNSTRDFADVYHDWSVAALIDAKFMGKTKYQFQGLDFKFDIGTPAAPNPEAFNTPGAPPWGTDYIYVNGDLKKLAKLTFNGLDYSTFPTDWTSDGNVLSSGGGDLIDNWAIFETVGGGTLTFDTSYWIEGTWDFAFVQVSTDGGYNWTSLSNGYTTDAHNASAHPKVIANLPGLTGCSGNPDLETPTCTPATVTMNFSLAPYAGQNILVAFRYVTDWGTSLSGWSIDNVYVDGNLISDGSDASVFKDITEVVPINNDFTVTFVGQKKIGKHTFYDVRTMHLNHVTEDGQMWLNGMLRWADSVVMLVTYDAAEGIDFYADYTYELSYKHSKPHSHKVVHGHGNGTHFFNPGSQGNGH